MATVNQPRTATMSQARTKQQFSWIPYLFILPHLIFFVTFLAWPFFYGIYISLFNFDFLRPENRPFVGLQNYADLLINRNSIIFGDFWRSLRNTGVFVLYSVPPLVLIALVLAVLLNGNYRGRNLYRGIYFAPYALSVTVAAVLWRWIFASGGLVNNAFLSLGINTQPAWLSSNPWAWIAITVCTVWWTIGFNTVIFLAALQEIPESLYEAASIDGANTMQKFFRITIPMLRPVLVFVITITLLASANLFGQPWIMTGLQYLPTEPVMMRIYNEGILQNRMGNAAAMSVLFAAILLVLTTLNFRVFGRSQEQ